MELRTRIIVVIKTTISNPRPITCIICHSENRDDKRDHTVIMDVFTPVRVI